LLNGVARGLTDSSGSSRSSGASCALAEGRAAPVFQPVIITTSRHDRGWRCERRGRLPDTVKLFLWACRCCWPGTWVGMRLYGRLDEASFRKVVLVSVLLSGSF